MINGLLVALDVLHYTLPKTNDAAVISKSLRKALSEARLAFKDETSGLKINVEPKGFTLQSVAKEDLPIIAVWTQPDGSGRITLKRWTYKERKRRQALKELDDQLTAMGILEVKKDRDHVLGEYAEVRRWSEPRNEQVIDRETLFFNGAGQLFTLEYELPKGWREDPEHEQDLREFQFSFDQAGEGSGRPDKIFEEHASWTGELKYNLSFSIASTLLWIAVVLGLACWRLSRIDF